MVLIKGEGVGSGFGEPRREEEPMGIRAAIFSPGQGGAFVGMGRDLYENSRVAREAFDEADEFLGFPISRLCFEGPKDELVMTGNQQLALLTNAEAALRATENFFPDFKKIKKVAGGGVSFGEMTALLAARVYDFKTGLYIVQQRGRIMHEVAGGDKEGAMSLVSGLDREIVDAICKETGVSGAIYYPGNRIVISGTLKNLKNAEIVCKERGAKNVIPAGVPYAFHSPIMGPAEEELKRLIKEMEEAGVIFNNPQYPIIANSTGEIVDTWEKLKVLIPMQMTNPVDSQKLIAPVKKLGANVVLELGPKRMLAGHINRVFPDLPVIGIHDMQSVQTLGENLQLLAA